MVTRRHIRTPRIVQPGTHNALWLWVLFVLLALVLAWQMFDYGRKRAGFDAAERDALVSELQRQISDLQRDKEQLRTQSARFERASQIDQAAVQNVQDELKALQDERSALRQEVEFLKSLVSGDITMLQLTDLALDKREQGNAYGYVFTVSKRAKGDERVRGQVVLTVHGQLKGEASELVAKDLGIDSKDLVMGFNFFQKFEGELTLPVGFIPRQLKVQVKPKGKKFKPFDQSFDWTVE